MDIVIAITGQAATVPKAVITNRNSTSRIWVDKSHLPVSLPHQAERMVFKGLLRATVTIYIQIVAKHQIAYCQVRSAATCANSRYSRSCQTRGPRQRERILLCTIDSCQMWGRSLEVGPPALCSIQGVLPASPLIHQLGTRCRAGARLATVPSRIRRPRA